MALKASLVITGEATSATAALGQVDAALEQSAASAKRAAAANDEFGRKVEQNARKAVTSTRQAQAGYVNLGRQVQDVAVQLQSGTNIGTIVAQQGGQVADALAQMGGRFGGLASFLAGPWGAAVIVGAGVLLNQLIPALFSAGDAAEKNAAALASVEAASDGVSSAQSALAGMFDLTTGAITSQNAVLRANIQLMAVKLRAEASTARSDALSAAKDSGKMAMTPAAMFSGRAFLSQNTVARSKIEGVLAGKLDPSAVIKWAEGADFSNSGVSRTEFIDGILRAAEVGPKNATADAIERSLGGALDPMFRKPGRPDKPSRGSRGRAGGDKVEFGEDVANKIAKIVDQFSELPPVVARSNEAMRQLDDIASDIEKKRPPNYDELKVSLAGAREAIEASLTRPLDEYLEKAKQTEAIDQLILAGKRDQAVALQDAIVLQRQMGPLTKEQLATILQTVTAERERGELLQQQQEKIGNYLDATRSVRNEIEAILAGNGKLSNLPQIFKNLQAKVLAEKLFGPMFRDLDRWVQDNSGMKSATTFYVDQTKVAGTAALELANAFRAAGGQIAAAASGGSRGGELPIGALGQGPLWDEHGAVPGNDEIVVTAHLPKQPGSLLDVSVDEYMRRMTEGTAQSLVDALNGVAGTQFFSKFTGSIAGAMQGYMVSGGSPWGAALGALKEIPGLPKGIADKLGGAFKGMATGAQIAGLAGAFGIKMSNTGAQVGGAIGGALPIPGGAIIGSLLGGALGGLFKKTKTGAVSIGNVDGEGAITGTAGNNADRKGAATGLGGGVNSVLAQFADRLGGALGDYAVAIGIRKDEFRVSASGSASATTKKKTSSDIIYKGKDEAAAVSAALANAIADGAITGLSDAVQRAIRANSSNVDKALAEALKVQDLEEMLAGLAGTAQKAFADFERQAKERLRVARAYGFDIVKVEELNAKERLKLSKQLLEEQVGSLQRLIDEMTGGSLFEGTAIDKRTSLLDQIAKAKADTDAGTEGAADKLAGLLEQLNAVSKDVYGTTGGFAADRSSILDQARDAIAQANQRIAEAQSKSDPALAQTNAHLDENNAQNAQIIALLAEQRGGVGVSPGAFDYAGLIRLASTQAQ
jgi:hypothetical protein